MEILKSKDDYYNSRSNINDGYKVITDIIDEDV